MKVTTSITLPAEMVSELGHFAASDGERSAFIEKALRLYFDLLRKEDRDQLDLELIDQNSDQLNEEALDILGFQAPL